MKTFLFLLLLAIFVPGLFSLIIWGIEAIAGIF